MRSQEKFLFNSAHLWCYPEGENVYSIGVSEFAQQSLGEIMYVELPDPDSEIVKDDSFGTIESPKVVNELYSPLSGIVLERNEALTDVPGRVNEAPYEDGWMLRIRLTGDTDLHDLMDSERYLAFVGKQ